MLASKKKVSILVLLTALLIYIISPVNILHSIAFANGTSSTIGGIEVEDLKDDDMRKVLSQAVLTYQSELMSVTGAGITEQLDLSVLQYDIDGTINEYNSLTEKPWYAFWEKKKVVQLPLKLAPNEAILQQVEAIPQWDAQATYSNVVLIASYLRSHEVEAVVTPIVNFDEERLAVAISEIPPTSTDIQSVIELLNDRVLVSNEEFAFLDELSPIYGTLNRETVNFTASILYQAALKLNAQINERHAHAELPSYLQYGLDAFVSGSQNKNFRFTNVHDQAVQLKLTRESTSLKVEFYAATPDETATIRVSRDEDVEPRTIVRYSNELAYGRSQVLEQGESGVRVTVYRTNSATGEEKVIARDYYPPKNKVVLKSVKQPPETTNPGENPGGSIDGDPNNPDNPGGFPNNPDGSWGGDGGSGTDGSGSGGTGSGSGSGGGSGNGNGSDEDDYDKGGNLIH